MLIEELQSISGVERIGEAPPIWHALCDGEQYFDIATRVAERGGRLVALWAEDCGDREASFALHAAFANQAGLLWLELPLLAGISAFPSLAAIFPAALRMERSVHDLLGLRPENLDDIRPWLRHNAWPADVFPLRRDFPMTQHYPGLPDNYSFIAVSGEGVHEVPVGPVHAGTIEPGHFRFQVVGEKVLRLEERLGFNHKGIEKHFTGMDLMQGARLAGRVSGDNNVGFALAYAQAVEGLTRTPVPMRAQWLRALLLERERVANHLGDLGALGNDAGLAFGLTQFGRLKELFLRTNAALFGHRYLLDQILPGGVAGDLEDAGLVRLRDEHEQLRAALTPLKGIYDEHAGLQDRFMGTGRVEPALAARLGLMGVAGRASGQAWDLRVQYPAFPYTDLDVNMATHRDGDVAARATVRFEEIEESLRLMDEILACMPDGEILAPLLPAPAQAAGIGWVEGWRGEILVWLRSDAKGQVGRCHPHDPSWIIWPAVEYAILGNIIADFPLINKSFNLSYSGPDL